MVVALQARRNMFKLSRVQSKAVEELGTIFDRENCQWSEILVIVPCILELFRFCTLSNHSFLHPHNDFYQTYSDVSIKNIDILPNRQYIANTANSAQERYS